METLSILAVTLVCLHLLGPWLLRLVVKLLGKPNQAAPLAAAPAVMPARLEIPGASREQQPWLSNALLNRFDIPAKRVQGVVWYTLKSGTPLPVAVAECLASCYRRGHARGVETMILAAHGRARPGSHIVFALVSAGNDVPDIYAVVA